jgi:hypothetical protein
MKSERRFSLGRTSRFGGRAHVRRIVHPVVLATCMILAGTLGTVGLEAGIAEAASTWTATASPDPGSSNVLYGVSCVISLPMCMAVGYSSDGPNSQTLVEQWNGSTWSVLSSSNPTTQNSLFGVSCANATSCMAVGESGNLTLAEVWNGTAWSVVPTSDPTSSYNILQSVSCTSSISCIAVGEDSTQGGAAGSVEPLSESWNGSEWTVITPVGQGSLDSVSCLASGTCTAVGSINNQGTLIEEWSGTAWSLISSPNPPNKYIFLDGVSCPSAGFCEAVGGSGDGSSYSNLTETWNGSTWTIASSPDPSTAGDYLQGISCPEVNDCVAAGVAGAGTYSYQTLIESWNGATWTVDSSANPSGTGDVVAGVSCGDATCQAVGNTTDETTSATQTLIESGTAPLPVTTVIIPTTGAALSGSTFFDATASSGVSSVAYELTGGNLKQAVVATATPTIYGWLAGWNSTFVPNGTYTLQSIATYPNGFSGPSAGVTFTVNNAPPTSTVLLPSSGASVSGTSSVLDASATSNVSGVTYELSGGALSGQVIATGTPTVYGWLAKWNTTTVPNGTYSLQSEASYVGGVTGTSPPITINVNNSPPSTTVVLPSSGATVDSSETQVYDATASPGVTKVLIEVTVEGLTTTLTATPWIYGWIATNPAYTCTVNCVPLSFPFSVQSVASYSGGVSGTSQPVNGTMIVYHPNGI